MIDATVLSVQAGRSRTFEDPEKKEAQWCSAIIKQPVECPVALSELGVAGDEQVDRFNHGGIDKAVLAYSGDHFEFWDREYPEAPLGSPSIPGAFGENLTIGSQTEFDVCVGDRWQVGSCVLQISQPRQPCWKLSRRWGLTDLANRVQKSGYSGWYLRVVEPGSIDLGDELTLIERSFPEWTIQAANEVMYREKSAARDRELADCPALSDSWKEQLLTRAEKRERS